MKKSRQAAIKAREKYYYTGKPCKHGHISKRTTAEGCCVKCRTISSARQAEQAKNFRALLNESDDA